MMTIRDNCEPRVLKRPDDYSTLSRKWRESANAQNWTLKTLQYSPGNELIYVENHSSTENNPAVYISAGIHGDEPAAPAGLLHWFQIHSYRWKNIPIIIFPCLNPEGYDLGIRTNLDGVDLNRQFAEGSVALVSALKKKIQSHPILYAITLHEDCGANGIYLYAIARKSLPLEKHLRNIPTILPVSKDSEIDGLLSKSGVITLSPEITYFTDMPEIRFIANQHPDSSAVVFETPTNYSFNDRQLAHSEFLTDFFCLQFRNG